MSNAAPGAQAGLGGAGRRRAAGYLVAPDRPPRSAGRGAEPGGLPAAHGDEHRDRPPTGRPSTAEPG
ncbi:hypothetical protein G6F32_013989 [Rhizopus arrhizus]|nr:hypothetical protein G6F32_013989 [Rhizopus arrhizus]